MFIRIICLMSFCLLISCASKRSRLLDQHNRQVKNNCVEKHFIYRKIASEETAKACYQ